MPSMKVVFIIIYLSMILYSRSEAMEAYYQQVATVIKFFEILNAEKSSVSKYFELFAKDNEAELELILRNKFPSLDIKKNWYDNVEAKKYIDDIYAHPDQYDSIFLSCIKSLEPEIASSNTSHLLEFPPKVNKDFRHFIVLTQGKQIIFEFSQDEQTIENVYLPNGKSIYTFILKCTESYKKHPGGSKKKK